MTGTRLSATSATSPLRTTGRLYLAVSAASGGISTVSTPLSHNLRCSGPGDVLLISRIYCVRFPGFGGQPTASARSKALRTSLQPTAEATSTTGGSRSSPTTSLKTRADTRTGMLSAGWSVSAQRASRRTSSTSTYPRCSLRTEHAWVLTIMKSAQEPQGQTYCAAVLDPGASCGRTS